MKDLRLLVWLTQLGLSTAVPLALFILLGVWLCNGLGWGQWTIWCGLCLGIASAINGFRDSLRAMELMSKGKKPPDPPPVSVNTHD